MMIFSAVFILIFSSQLTDAVLYFSEQQCCINWIGQPIKIPGCVNAMTGMPDGICEYDANQQACEGEVGSQCIWNECNRDMPYSVGNWISDSDGLSFLYYNDQDSDGYHSTYDSSDGFCAHNMGVWDKPSIRCWFAGQASGGGCVLTETSGVDGDNGYCDYNGIYTGYAHETNIYSEILAKDYDGDGTTDIVNPAGPKCFSAIENGDYIDGSGNNVFYREASATPDCNDDNPAVSAVPPVPVSEKWYMDNDKDGYTALNAGNKVEYNADQLCCGDVETETLTNPENENPISINYRYCIVDGITPAVSGKFGDFSFGDDCDDSSKNYFRLINSFPDDDGDWSADYDFFNNQNAAVQACCGKTEKTFNSPALGGEVHSYICQGEKRYVDKVFNNYDCALNDINRFQYIFSNDGAVFWQENVGINIPENQVVANLYQDNNLDYYGNYIEFTLPDCVGHASIEIHPELGIVRRWSGSSFIDKTLGADINDDRAGACSINCKEPFPIVGRNMWLDTTGCGGTGTVWCECCCIGYCEGAEAAQGIPGNCTLINFTTGWSERAVNPTIISYQAGKIVTDNLIQTFGVTGSMFNLTKYISDYFQGSYLTHNSGNCADGKPGMVANSICTSPQTSGNSVIIPCSFPLPAPFPDMNKISVYYGCVKMNGIWVNSSAEYVNITNSIPASCGNGNIDTGENCSSCPNDAGCGNGQICCGDSVCRNDCANNPSPCNNNGICDFGENCNCADCNNVQDGCGLNFNCGILQPCVCNAPNELCLDGKCCSVACNNGMCPNQAIIPLPPSNCGNGLIDNAEECDAGNLDGKTCSDFGLVGILTCSSCSFNTSTCAETNSGCGNGICGTGENWQTCPQDCPMHTICNSSNPPACIAVSGTGNSECFLDSECRINPFFYNCSGINCLSTNGNGNDLCLFGGNDCNDGMRGVCNETNSCILVAGEGANMCITRDDCIIDDMHYCGNNEIEPGEECDGANITLTCSQIDNYAGGNIRCAPNCQLDESECILGEGGSLYWANMVDVNTQISKADKLDRVRMVWPVSGLIDGEEVNFSIREDDTLLDDSLGLGIDDNIRTGNNVVRGKYNATLGKAVGEWKMTQADWDAGYNIGEGNEEEFYFSASAGTKISGKSYNLIVNITPKNSLPQAIILTPRDGDNFEAGQAISFTQASYDEDSAITTDWNFGDGQHSSQRNTNHAYSSNGQKNIVMTVTDETGASDSDEISILVSNFSILNSYVFVGILKPDEGELLANQTVYFNASSSYAYFYNITDDKIYCMAGACPSIAGKIVLNSPKNYSAIEFNWSLDDNYRAFGAGLVSFSHYFAYPSVHYADLHARANPSASLRRTFEIGVNGVYCNDLLGGDGDYWITSNGAEDSLYDCRRDDYLKPCCPLGYDCINDRCTWSNKFVCGDYGESECFELSDAVIENTIYQQSNGKRCGSYGGEQLIANCRAEWNGNTCACSYSLVNASNLDEIFGTCSFTSLASEECSAGLKRLSWDAFWSNIEETNEYCQSGDKIVVCKTSGLLGFFSVFGLIISSALVIIYYLFRRNQINASVKPVLDTL